MELAPELARAVRGAYEAFNLGEIESPLSLMHDDVDWANTIEGGREQGRAAVRAYWTRVRGLLVPRVEPLRLQTAGPDVTVVFGRQRFSDRTSGEPLAHEYFQHVFTWRGELVARMDAVEPKLAERLRLDQAAPAM